MGKIKNIFHVNGCVSPVAIFCLLVGNGKKSRMKYLKNVAHVYLTSHQVNDCFQELGLHINSHANNVK